MPDTPDLATPLTAECGLYFPTDNTICAAIRGHDGGVHEPEQMEALAFRESEHRAFLTRQHEGKRAYGSKSEAKRIAGMTSARLGGRPKEPYRCEVCHLWHVGEAR